MLDLSVILPDDFVQKSDALGHSIFDRWICPLDKAFRTERRSKNGLHRVARHGHCTSGLNLGVNRLACSGSASLNRPSGHEKGYKSRARSRRYYDCQCYQSLSLRVIHAWLYWVFRIAGANESLQTFPIYNAKCVLRKQIKLLSTSLPYL
jgi:hypothetical protein